MRSVAALARGMAHLWEGDEERTQRLLTEAVTMAQAAGNVTVGLFALGFRTMLAVRQGRLRQAAVFYEQVIALGTIEGNLLYGPAGFACVQMGEVLREWNRLEEAEAMLLQGIRLCQQQTGMPIWIVEGHVNLARLKLAKGDEDEAEKVMGQAEALLLALPEQDESRRHFLASTHAYRLRYWLARGEVEAAQRWLAKRNITVDSDISPGEEMTHLLLARTLMAGGELDEAGRQLRRLRPNVEAATSQRLAVEFSILEALQLQAQGEEDDALDALSQALWESEQEGYVRLFVDNGQALPRLLSAVAEQGRAPAVAGAILAAMDVEGVAGGGVAATTGGLLEPLNDQERHILRLMAAGRTNREIAGELFLSVNTIKVYASRLYSKLDVHRRGEAVARARALGIL
jgi:LuxR family maltose regulon positive regulatory protein